MSATDVLELNKSSMFEKIRSALPVGVNTTNNLLEVKDDLLFVWDLNELCLLALNWRTAIVKGHDQIKHQTLIPSVPQTFHVHRVVASIEGSLIALVGYHGIAVLELPRRWGPNGQFMEGKDTIICRASNLDAHFFDNNTHIQIQQVRWHPGSPADSHLLVLLSDNTIRLYDNYTLRHVWKVGPLPMAFSTNSSFSKTLPNPAVLGESVVDFEIGPAVVASTETKDDSFKISTSGNFDTSMGNYSRLGNETIGNLQNKKVEWPIVLLRQNGNIYVLFAGLDTAKPRLQGPLTIQPQTVQNYGVDSCALLIIPSLPLTLVIAESTGKLHHALLLENETPEESFDEVDANMSIYPSEWTLNVLETVELEIGITDLNDTGHLECMVHLKRDPNNDMRYFAYHNGGLHAVTINFVDELDRYLDSDVVSDLSGLSSISRAEYLVCTKISNDEKTNAVLGFVILQLPSTTVLFLASGQVISLNVIIDMKLLSSMRPGSDNSNDNDLNSSLSKTIGPSFIEHIQNILKRTVTQPIMSLNKSSQPAPQECYELLIQAIEVLRVQYIKKLEEGRNEFLQKLNTIKLRKEQQKKDIEHLEQERQQIRENAHKLAERLEEINENQEKLLKKCQGLMRQANTCLPGNNQAEKGFAQEVKRIDILTKGLAAAQQKARDTINKQNYHIQAQKYSKMANKMYTLPEKQDATIREILTQMTAEIEGQIREVKRINNVLNI